MAVLGLSGTSSNHMYRLHNHEKQVITRNSVGFSYDVIGTLFVTQAPSATLISESGLYKVILRSNKPEARQFQNWVTEAVLPAIRKDGMYVQGEEKVVTGEMTEDELIRKAMTLLDKKVERLSKVVDSHIMSISLPVAVPCTKLVVANSKTT